MKIINFQYIHIVCCRNLQLTVRWLLRVSLKLWESHTLDTQIPLEFKGGLLSWLTSWTSHRILKSAPSSAGMMRLCLLFVAWWSYHFLQPSQDRDQLHLHHHVSTWCASVVVTTTTLTRLRCFVRRALTRQGRVSPTPRNDENITQFASYFYILGYFEFSCFLYCVFSTTSVIFKNQTFVKPINPRLFLLADNKLKKFS